MLEMVNYKNALLSYLPIVGQQQAISQLIRGELQSYTPLIICSAVTILSGLVLIKIIGFSVSEKAAKLDISESLVKVRVHRAIRKLKQMMEADQL